MESSFYKNYYKYFLWNNGLIKYYLSDKKSKDDIKLYVDEGVLARIGRNIEGIKDFNKDSEYKEDFMKSVEGFCNYYNKYDNYYRCPLPLLADPNRDNDLQSAKLRVMCSQAQRKNMCNHPGSYCVKMKCIEKTNATGQEESRKYFDFYRSDFLAVAKHISSMNGNEEGMKYFYQSDAKKYVKNSDGKPIKFDLPFFAIIIYIILRFDEGEIQKWSNLCDRTLEEKDKSYKCYVQIATSSRAFINDLWQVIQSYNKRFDCNASVFSRDFDQRNDYVGKILYHLPFSAPLRRRINDAIYMSGIWSSYNTMSFREQFFRIKELIPENKQDELSVILKECFTNEDYKNIYKSKIKDLLYKFDIDEYRESLEQKKNKHYSSFLLKGRLALAIYLPTIESGKENEIRLYTTIPQEMEINGYRISEATFSLYGYNGSPVKLNGRTSVSIKDHTTNSKEEKIKLEAISHYYDVVFFYTHDRDDEAQLFFQTEELIPAKSYFVAVKDVNEIKQHFDKWCLDNNNHPQICDKKDTIPLFGKDWIIYYKEGGWNGQYYKNQEYKEELTQDLDADFKNGGIKNNEGNYFINSLPYFEIPERYIINDIKVFINFDSYESMEPAYENEYEILISGRKLIINLLDISRHGEDIRCYLSLEYNGESIYNCDFKVCGQNIKYSYDVLCKFNKFGQLTTDKDAVVSGNKFLDNCQKLPRVGPILSGLKELNEIPSNTYLISLLSAICYNKKSLDIRPTDFNKCISYAKTRFCDNQEVDSKKIEKALVTAGFINIDYSKNPRRIQIVPPAFAKVPRSVDGAGESYQLYMLTGAYTKTFLGDLINFCSRNNVKIYYLYDLKDKNGSLCEFLPAPILLGHNFNAINFLCDYNNHQFDIFENEDIAYSLLNNTASFKDVLNILFKNDFHKKDAPFLSLLDETNDNYFPRIREDKKSYCKHWYIEKEDNYFGEIDKSLIEWAYLYCYLKINKILIVVDADQEDRRNAIYLPNTLQLPWMIRRALYMMNIGHPKTEETFVCSSGCKLPYQKMDKYVLTSKQRIDLVASLLVDTPEFIKPSIKKKEFSLEFWEPKRKFGDSYFVLKEHNDSLAIASKNKKMEWEVFLKDRNTYRKIEGPFNDVMSFLIEKSWEFNSNPSFSLNAPHTSIGIRHNYEYKSYFDISEESINPPNEIYFKSKPIIII